MMRLGKAESVTLPRLSIVWTNILRPVLVEERLVTPPQLVGLVVQVGST